MVVCMTHTTHIAALNEHIAKLFVATAAQQAADPVSVARFAAELQRELDELWRDARSSSDKRDQALSDVRGRIANLVRRLEGEDEGPLSLIRRLKELEAEEATLHRQDSGPAGQCSWRQAPAHPAPR
jgi:hypothetical protein